MKVAIVWFRQGCVGLALLSFILTSGCNKQAAETEPAIPIGAARSDSESLENWQMSVANVLRQSKGLFHPGNLWNFSFG